MNFAELIDVTVALSPDLTVWPGDPAIEFEPTSRIADGDSANVSRLAFGTHCGTHMDAPRHFIEGASTVDQMPLQALVGTAYVIDLTHLDRHIGAADLAGAGLPDRCERILLKTRNSAYWKGDRTIFQPDYLALAYDGAAWLLARGLILVGIDYLSIEQFQTDSYETHRLLLQQGVVIVEGLDLSQVEAGEYTLFALPLRVKNGDGAPARVLLGR